MSDFHLWAKNITAVPTVTFGLTQADTSRNLFTVANFPGASAANLTTAQALYATLTGSITTIAGNARIDEGTGQYVYQGAATQRGRMLIPIA